MNLAILEQRRDRPGIALGLYGRSRRLFAELDLAHGDGRFTRLFRTLVKADLLILDDWGPDGLTANQRERLHLMEVLAKFAEEKRFGINRDWHVLALVRSKDHRAAGSRT